MNVISGKTWFRAVLFSVLVFCLLEAAVILFWGVVLEDTYLEKTSSIQNGNAGSKASLSVRQPVSDSELPDEPEPTHLEGAADLNGMVVSVVSPDGVENNEPDQDEMIQDSLSTDQSATNPDISAHDGLRDSLDSNPPAQDIGASHEDTYAYRANAMEEGWAGISSSRLSTGERHPGENQDGKGGDSGPIVGGGAGPNIDPGPAPETGESAGNEQIPADANADQIDSNLPVTENDGSAGNEQTHGGNEGGAPQVPGGSSPDRNPPREPPTLPDPAEAAESDDAAENPADTDADLTETEEDHADTDGPPDPGLPAPDDRLPKGWIVGEVYDDSTGLPVPAVPVTLMRTGGKMPAETVRTFSNDRGKYRLGLPEGHAVLRIAKDGYVPVYRTAAVPPGAVLRVMDARITPIDAGQPINQNSGGSVDFKALNARASIPSAAFSTDVNMSLTRLSNQSLPGLLPLGWSPVAAYYASCSGTGVEFPAMPIILRLNDVEISAAAPGEIITALWDENSDAWIRVASSVNENECRVILNTLGGIVLVRPDVLPEAPDIPGVGEPLTGVTPVSMPDAAALELLPRPEVLFLGSGAASDVTLVLDSTIPLPSGTPMAVKFTESYHGTDGIGFSPDSMEQDISLYSAAGGLSGRFAARPSIDRDAARIKEGLIRLEAGRSEEHVTGTIVGRTGGAIAADGGISLVVPANATPVDIPVSLAFLSELPQDLVLPPGIGRIDPPAAFTGIAVDLGGALLSDAATLFVPLPAASAGDHCFLLVRALIIGGGSRYELVSVGTPEADGVAFDDRLSLPGIREDGRYYMIRMNGPFAVLTGNVSAGLLPAAAGLVETDRHPFISRTSTADPAYVLIVPAGQVTVSGRDVVSGAATVSTITAAAGTTLALDLSLETIPPAVLSTTPAADAEDVAIDSPVSVVFSRRMAVESFRSDTFRMSDGNGSMDGRVSLSADGRTAVFRPSVPLSGHTVYTVILTEGICDVYGNPLQTGASGGMFSMSFTTRDQTSPTQPDPGEIIMPVPANGTTTISGSRGTFAPGSLVTAVNLTTQITTTVSVDDDGSFSLLIEAEPAHTVELTLRDPAGNETVYDPGPFTDPDGTTVIGEAGGAAYGVHPETRERDGTKIIVPPGAVPDGTMIRVSTADEAGMGIAVPEMLDGLGVLRLEMGDRVAGAEIKASISAPDGMSLTPDSQILVLQAVDFFGSREFTLVNVARYKETPEGPRIETTSPPFCGLMMSGFYAFATPAPGMKPLVCGSVVPSAWLGSRRAMSEAGFRLVDHPKLPGYMTIIAVPADHPFTVHAYDDAGNEIAARTFDPPAEPFAELLIPAAEDLEGELAVSEMKIGAGSEISELIEGDVPTGAAVDTETAVIFTKQVTDVTPENLVLEKIDADGTASTVKGAVAPKYGEVNGKKILQGAVFAPDVRLKYDTEYRVTVKGLKDFAGGVMPEETVRAFRTFRPRVIGSVAVPHPHDIDFMDVGGAAKRLIVADGDLSDEEKENHGVMMIDVEDPSRPLVLSETPVGGHTFGVFAVPDAAVPGGLLQGPSVLAVSGGAESFGVMRIYNIAGKRLDQLRYKGFKPLSVPEGYFFEGFTRPGVPPQSGIPMGVSLYGADNAYIPVIGIGILAVNLSEAILQHQGKDVNHSPGKRVMYSAATADTAGGVLLAGDMRELVLLSPDLAEEYATLDIPARYIHGADGFPVGVNDAGQVVTADLAFVGDSGGRLHIIDVKDPRHPNILQQIETGDFIRCIQADADRRLVYVSSMGTVVVVDADDLIGENRDRILGTVDDLSEHGGDISAIDIDNRGIGYAADPDRGKIHTLLLGCPDRRIYIESGEYPVPPGGRVTLKTEPEMDVRWEIVGVSPDTFNPKSVRLDAGTGSLSVQPGAGSGRVRVRAVNRDIRGCDLEAWIRIGCGCTACVGKGEFSLNSVDVRINLGAESGGRPAGELLIHSEGIGDALANPAILEHSVLGRDTAVVRDEHGVIRRIVTGRHTVDVDSTDDGYEIRFASQAGGTPFVVWRFEMAGSEDDRRFVVSEIREGAVIRETAYDTDGRGNIRLMRLDGDGSPLREEILEKRTEGDTEIQIRTMFEEGRLAATYQSEYQTFPWGKAVVKAIQDPGGAALSTTYEYYTDEDGIGYGLLKRSTGPDGDATTYTYDAQDRLVTELRTWLDTPGGRTITYDYTPLPGDAERAEDQNRPRTRTEIVGGIVTAKSYVGVAYDASSGERTEITERSTVPSAGWGDPSNLRTTRTYYAWSRIFASGRLKSVVYPDGRTETHRYETGAYTGSGDPALPGRFISGIGTDVRQSVVRGSLSHPDGVPYKTTREMTVTDEFGRTFMTETDVYTGMGYERMQWTVRILDDQGRLTAEYRSDGTIIENIWGCCRIEQNIDAMGLRTAFVYDGLDRPISEIRESLDGDILTETLYSVTDTGRKQVRIVSAGALRLSTETEVDRLGKTVQSIDAEGLVTRYAYADDGRTTTVIHPGGITETTERYLDGQIRRVSGTGVVEQNYAYGVNADGTQWTRVTIGDPDASAPRFETTVTDMAGRTVRTEKPGFSEVEIAANHYDDAGRMVRKTVPGQAETLYVYDELGDTVRSGLDVDGSGDLEPASTDRIADAATRYRQIDGKWWRESIRKIYPGIDDQAVTLGSRRTRVSGLGTSGSGGILTAESVYEDIHGNETVQRSYIDRAAKSAARIVDVPDSETDMVSVSQKGLPVSSTRQTGITVTYGYDALGRKVRTVDPRTGADLIEYDEKGRVTYTENAVGDRTTFLYDELTGRRIAVKNAMGKYTRQAYNDRGQIIRTWGYTAYPTACVYDDAGRLIELHTFRTGTGWSGETWPEVGTDSADVTRWIYDEATGLLTAKEYADGKRTAYAYGPAGMLDTRTWARTKDGRALTTRYDYDPATGELTGIDYGDDTPDLTFTYDRLGRRKTVTDAAGSRTFVYTDDLQLGSETITGIYNQTITRNYETEGLPGRPAGFTLGNADSSAYAVGYEYDAFGRFDAVSWNVEEKNGRVDYAYMENADLIERMSTPTGLSTIYTYDPQRNLKTSVENVSGETLISRYAYQYDRMGRRISVVNTGTAFAQDTFNRYSYNDRSELVSSRRYHGADVNHPESPITDENRTYAYDSIGNRTATTAGAQQTRIYETNVLNQYTAVKEGEATVESPVYDDDGNLIVDRDQKYTWNAENRLVTVEPATPGIGDQRLEMTYDYMGRRVQKLVFTHDGTAWKAYPDTEKLFVYDGWNMVKEITTTGNHTTDKYYVWGLDLSQSLQGAGGIGGLLCAVDDGTVLNYLYDVNGNVGQLVNISDGGIEANYQYDPYGNMSEASGNYADRNFYQFSTKYFDFETETYHYGFRYYILEFGRWSSRDPIGERGGKNLQEFAWNNAINYSDFLGLALYAFDGTGADENTYTHISMLRDSYSKVAEYEQGIGSTFYSRILGGMTGFGGGLKLESMYLKLLRNYKLGDHDIDIIGFSRGAALAREFVNMIHERGIAEIKSVYKAVSEGPNEWIREAVRVIECHPIIRFVGLFDTVGAFGYPWNDINLGIRMDMPQNVMHAAHAVARHEHRSAFSVTQLKYPKTGQHFMQEIFDGDHSDIGGAHMSEQNYLAIEPLVYIWEAGRNAGVPFGNIPFTKRESLFGPYMRSWKPHDLTMDWKFRSGPSREHIVSFDQNNALEGI